MCVLRCALPLFLCLSSSLSLCLCLFVYIAQDRCVPCRWAQGLLRGTTAFRMRFMNKLPIAITKSRETGRARERGSESTISNGTRSLNKLKNLS